MLFHAMKWNWSFRSGAPLYVGGGFSGTPCGVENTCKCKGHSFYYVELHLELHSTALLHYFLPLPYVLAYVRTYPTHGSGIPLVGSTHGMGLEWTSTLSGIIIIPQDLSKMSCVQ